MSLTIDDVTTASSFKLKPEFSELAHALSSDIFHVSRDDTYRWVHGNMKFLVCDESDDNDNEGDAPPSPDEPSPLPVYTQRIKQGYFGKRGHLTSLESSANAEKLVLLNVGPTSSHLDEGNGNRSGAVSSFDSDGEGTRTRPIPTCETCS